MNSGKPCFPKRVLTGLLLSKKKKNTQIKKKKSKSYCMQRCTHAIRILYNNTQDIWPWTETNTTSATEANKNMSNYQLKNVEKRLGQNKYQKSIIKTDKSKL